MTNSPVRRILADVFANKVRTVNEILFETTDRPTTARTFDARLDPNDDRDELVQVWQKKDAAMTLIFTAPWETAYAFLDGAEMVARWWRFQHCEQNDLLACLGPQPLDDPDAEETP